MVLQHFNLEFLDHNRQRNYPLDVEASGYDKTKSFRLPEDFIVELDIPVHAAMPVNPANFFIRELGVFPSGYFLKIAHDNGTSVSDIAFAAISRQEHTKFKTYSLGGVAPYEDTTGKVVIGTLTGLDEQPPGVWQFNVNDGRLDPDAVRPIIRGVQAVVVVNNGEKSARYYGDIEIEAGTNAQITPVIVEGQNPKLVFSFIAGEGTIAPCLCDGEIVRPCITTINGVPPNAGGTIFIGGDDCISVETQGNSLQLINRCSAPCCSCEELERITEDLERFNIQRETLEQFVSSVRNTSEQFSLTVLGARLGDQGCENCE